jgi:two-component system NtrC family sensor kinase
MNSTVEPGGAAANAGPLRDAGEPDSSRAVTLGFSLIVLLVVMLLGLNAVRVRDLNQRIDRIVHTRNAATEAVHKMSAVARHRSLLLAEIAMETDPFEQDAKVQRFFGLASEFVVARQQFAAIKHTDAAKGLLAQQSKDVAEIQPLQDRVIELVLAEQRSEASKLLMERVVPAQGDMLSVLDALTECELEESRDEAAAAEREARSTLGFMLAGGMLVALLSLTTGVLVSRRMSTLVARLAAKEREARGLLENIPDLVWYKNDAAQLLWANHALEQATALAGSDLAGKTEGEIWQAGAEDCVSEDGQARDAKETVSFDKTLTVAAGGARQYALSRTPIYDAHGGYQGMLCVARDTSERELMSRHLKSLLAEVETQQTALDQHAIVSIADVSGNIIYVNDKFCQVSGYERGELIGNNHRMLKSSQHPQEFYAGLWATIASGRVWQGEVCNRRKDGGHYWVESTIVPFLDEHGLPQRYVSIRTDITPLKDLERAMRTANEELGQRVSERTAELSAAKTALEADIAERKRSEAALQDSERWLRGILDAQTDAVFVISPERLVVDVNEAGQKMSGYSRAEIVNHSTAMAHVDQAHYERFGEHLREVFQGKSVAVEFSLKRKSGEIFPADIRVSALRGNAGAVSGIVTVIRDITAQKQAEAALRTSHAELEGAYRHLEEAQSHLLQSEKLASIGQLAAGVAHEINNPIGYVYSNLGSLEQYLQELFEVLEAYESSVTDPPAPVREVTQRIDVGFLKEDIPALMGESREGITRVKKIVQDLKDFSHVDASDEWQFSDLHKGLDSTLNIVNNEIKYKAEVKKEYGALPEVECLAPQLNQVFMNLLVNAAHAIDERGTISIRSGTLEDQVWVEIADSGKGIAAENLKRIFDPFFTTKAIGKGTGLGLSLSYGIIQKHHGRIEVESEVGKGTTFRVWLPMKQPEAESAKA